MSDAHPHDEAFREVFLRPIRKCASYRPAFGQGRSEGLDFAAFSALYGGDPFYAWLGLNHEYVYAAHRAAGGLTSVYRQIGIGAERLVRSIVATQLELHPEQMQWSYEYAKPDKSLGTHTLDLRIRIADVPERLRAPLTQWLSAARASLRYRADEPPFTGVVFEVRQGYKSADSKRQNADLRYGLRAAQEGLLPAFAILSNQVSEPVMSRYRADRMLVLTGTLAGDATTSTYAFFRNVVGYDLAAFFARNSAALRAEITSVIGTLLSADGDD